MSNRTLVHLMLFMMAITAGCQNQKHSSVPISIQKKPPYSYAGRIGRIWGGDNFEVVDQGKLHYAFIRGIDCPEAGQPFHEESKAMLRELCRHRTATIEVVERDQWKREVCELTVADSESGETIEPALELLSSGLAWFDQSEGPWAEGFHQAELDARKKKIGIWSQANPVPPWEFWEKQQQQTLGEK